MYGLKNKTVILLLLDISAAFDTVDHLILLNRLGNRFGICGSPLAWFKSYLTDRFHLVGIRGARSTTRPLLCGVPQGSVQGKTTSTIFKEQLEEKKRKYQQRVLYVKMGYFTSLVFGTNGGMAVDYNCFLKRLAEKLLRKE